MEDQAYKLDDLWPISEHSDSVYHRATLQIIYWDACLLTKMSASFYNCVRFSRKEVAGCPEQEGS